MWLELIEYLKDPHLVADIQRFFGVNIHYCKCLNNVEPEKNRQNDDNFLRPDILKECTSNRDKETINGFCVSNECSNGHKRVNNSVERKKLNGFEQEPHHFSLHCSHPAFTITNHFWYYLFLFGTELGDEIFYCAFIPFWFWNVDGAVGRRVVLVWAIVMSIGQMLKDVIRWPRPTCPPAVRLQSKWSQEYGMPSTHAMIGITIPFSVVLFTMNRYIYSFPVGCLIATLWCMLVCTSRIYLGMHTVLDIVAGLILAIVLMIPLIPIVDITDCYIISNAAALGILITISIAIIIYYPKSDRWTPTRGDTAMVVSVVAGVYLGAWVNVKTGAFMSPPLPPPYEIIWPSYNMLGCLILRTILGFCSVIATRAICKSLSYATMCAIFNVNSKEIMNSKNDLGNRTKIIIDLVYKYVTCFMIGVNTVYLLPNVFTMIGIERPTFYTEM